VESAEVITSNCSPSDEYRYVNASLIIQHVNSLPIKTCIKQSITLNDSIKHTERNFTVRTPRRAFNGGMTFTGNDVLARAFLKGYQEKLNPTKLECPKIKIEIIMSLPQIPNANIFN